MIPWEVFTHLVIYQITHFIESVHLSGDCWMKVFTLQIAIIFHLKSHFVTLHLISGDAAADSIVWWLEYFNNMGWLWIFSGWKVHMPIIYHLILKSPCVGGSRREERITIGNNSQMLKMWITRCPTFYSTSLVPQLNHFLQYYPVSWAKQWGIPENPLSRNSHNSRHVNNHKLHHL